MASSLGEDVSAIETLVRPVKAPTWKEMQKSNASIKRAKPIQLLSSYNRSHPIHLATTGHTPSIQLQQVISQL
jgi:hypothetical protein